MSDFIGKKIEAIRQSQRLTQETVILEAGMARSAYQKIESGDTSNPRPVTLEKIARVFGLTVSELKNWKEFGQVVDHRKKVSDGGLLDQYVPAIQKGLLQADVIACGLKDSAISRQPLTITSLRQEIAEAYRLRQASRYEALGAMLPDMLVATQRAMRTRKNYDQQELFWLHVEANHVAAAFLKKAGRHDLAWVAIDRASLAAEHTDSVLLKAACAYRLSNLLQETGQLEEAYDIVSRSISVLDNACQKQTPPFLSMKGALWLKASAIATRQRDDKVAGECLSLASTTAVRLGKDRNDFWMAFGPTNVAIHRLSRAVSREDWDGALVNARSVNLSRFPSGLLERRARYLVDRAYSHAAKKEDAEAVQTLLEAERRAPEELRQDENVTLVLEALLAQERKAKSPGLRGMAQRAGLIP